MRVRGFAGVDGGVQMRLKAMAAERAPTMATMIQMSFSPKARGGKRFRGMRATLR